MDRLLTRLERTFGRFALQNLPLFILVGTAMAFVLSLLRPAVGPALVLDPQSILQGQVWRLVSFIFVPRSSSVLWTLISLWFYFSISRDLEAEWGAFKLNAYYGLGMALTIAASFATGAPATGYWLNGSLFLAFAALYPEAQILVYIVPVPARILGILTGLYYAYAAVTEGWSTRIGVGAALVTFAVFFAGRFRGVAAQRRVLAEAAQRRESFRAPAPVTATTANETMGHRKCAICGALEEDGADIRVCSCEKCGGTPRNLCLDHARNH
jgi:hypothetical protein